MKQTSIFLLILTILLAVETTTSRAQVPPGNWRRVYTNQEFTSPIRLDDLDSVLFYNCTFRNITEAPYALRLTNCTNVLVQECAFSDIQTKSGGRVLEIVNCNRVVVDDSEFSDHTSEGHSSAIHMKGSRSANITIRNCYIHDVSGNGIASGSCSSCPDVFTHDVPNPNLRVLNNRIENVGLYSDPTGNSPKHGMYIKATDPLIEGNRIFNSHDGSGISMRSTGIVRNNLVKNVKLGGIGGSFMKPAGPSATLIIENNVVIQEWTAVNIPNWAHLIGNSCCNSYPKRYDNSIVRFNTVVVGSQINPKVEAIRVDVDDRRDNDRVYGNLMVDLRSTPSFWDSEENIEYKSNNFFITNLNDFVDPAALDFRLRAGSSLIGSITEEPEYPAIDKAGTALAFPLEPGAYQYVTDEPTEGPAPQVTVRALGSTGEEQLILVADEVVIGEPVTLSTSMANYRWLLNSPASRLRVQFVNDGNTTSGTDKNVRIDYLVVGKNTLQAENQSLNTGSWNEAENSCGGVASEWLYCSGYIGFGSEAILSDPEVASARSAVSGSALQVYPNPSQDRVTVRLPRSARGATALQVLSMTGQFVRSTWLKDQRQTTLSLGELPPGTYLIKAIGDSRSWVERLVIE